MFPLYRAGENTMKIVSKILQIKFFERLYGHFLWKCSCRHILIGCAKCHHIPGVKIDSVELLCAFLLKGLGHQSFFFRPFQFGSIRIVSCQKKQMKRPRPPKGCSAPFRLLG